MNSPTLRYIITHEQWNAGLFKSINPEPALHVEKIDADGETVWDLTLVDASPAPDDPAVQLRMFDESFTAFTDAPEVFAALASGELRTLPDVAKVLDGLGFTDATERTQPHRAPPDCLVCGDQPKPSHYCPDCGRQG
ncbi:hypothetical protein [Micromonospora sp. DT47]|uniref:hypothetical protein n=1 Tax=Micromonospora sp. DT47 TaxID=3393431 RepID=UPI003CE6B821